MLALLDMIRHSAEHTFLFILFMSIATSIYNKKIIRIISGGEGVVSLDRVVINMSSLCFKNRKVTPLLNCI